jgi:hypothetical protein
MTGVRTHAVVSAVILEAYSSDSKQLPFLVDHAAKSFQLKEVVADAGYAGKKKRRKDKTARGKVVYSS